MRRRLSRLAALAGLGGGLLLAPRPAAAGASSSEKKIAKEMLTDAIADEKAGKCADAVESLRQILKIQESAEALLHLGECLVKTGKLVEGLHSWEHAEDLARDEKDKATQQALLPKLAALRERVPNVALQVPDDAPTVALTVDGQPLARERAGTPFPLDPGEHTIEAKADGRVPFSKKITVAEKDSTVVAVALPSVDGPRAAAPPAKAGFPLGTWIAGSAGLAMVAGGVGAFVAAGSAASDGQAACAKLLKCDPGPAAAVRKLDATALSLWIGGAVGLGLAVTLAVVDGPAKPKASAWRGGPVRMPAPRLIVGPGTLAVEGRF